MQFFAHSNDHDKSKWQNLKDHLQNTANIASELGAFSGLSEFAALAAILHDIGKYSQAFQKKLDGERLTVDHSSAGALEITKFLIENPNQKFIATILAYCVTGHHSGLLDYGSEIDLPTDGTLVARLKKQLEDYSAYNTEIDLSSFKIPDRIPINPNPKYPFFSISFFTRMIYSTLVDADFLETENFIHQGNKQRGEYESIEILCKRFNHYLERFENPENEINRERTRTLKTCLSKASQKPGFFSLTVPTGGGKTFSSMAFALNHAVINGLRRIIYVIPYTSIIEQNAAEFKRCLGDENVLEHHSNFDWGYTKDPKGSSNPDDLTNTALKKLKLAAENWDIPIVVTTNVQFFESLFANRSSRCRKLHNLAKSVIIFDEAQMLPIEFLKPCLFGIHELVTNYGAAAVFCTATQPAVEKFLPGGVRPQELTDNPQILYEKYKRVQVVNAGKLNDDVLAEMINEQLQALCIVNTRKHAKGIFEKINSDGRFHLSTLMCPAHRKQTISEIRERLKAGQPCRVISTQIMEAGIDVDFPIGYRAVSGLDSIIQAAGRVNREARQKMGNIYIFEPDSPHVRKIPPYIQQGAGVTQNILRNYPDPVSVEAIRAYFEKLYTLQSERNFDACNILDYFEKRIPQELNFDFKTAAEQFKLIDDDTVAVIIPFDNHAQTLLQEVRTSLFPASYGRSLQVYSVNIYEREFQTLQDHGFIDRYADSYSVLNDINQYHPETGLVIPETSRSEAIFFDG